MKRPPRPPPTAAELGQDIGDRHRNLSTNPGDGEPWPGTEEETSAELYYYDMALVVAANVLALPAVPPPVGGGRRRLTARQRNQLEERLAEAGCDVRSPAPPPDPEGG